MGKEERSKKSIRKIRKLLLICGLLTVIMAASTYAWFVGMRTVELSKFDVEIKSTDSLLLSLNGADWDTTVSISEATFDSASYVGNTNKWAGRGLIPVSSVGEMAAAASRMMIYEKASLTSTPGGYRLMASRVDNYSAPTADEPDGYVVFDLFVKNFSGAQYLENLNILDEEAIYLKTDSAVTVAESGVANTGIENSVRVAFAQIGRVKGTEKLASRITGLECFTGVDNGRTGICRTHIWEPNETKHESNAISWYETSCLARTGADVTDEDSYSGVCETVSDGNAYPTYAINDNILLADNVDIYDGTAYNGYTPSAKTEVVDTFTDTEKLLTGTSRPALMMLAPNSITKIRIYIYIEGQDIDNYDFASIGKAISVNFGFTKDRFDMEASMPEEESSIYTSLACFDTAGDVIEDYLDYEDSSPLNAACPRDVVIPRSKNGFLLTTIGNDAFSGKNLTSVVMPDTITTIETAAFSSNSIESIIIPNSVTSIGASAFGLNNIGSITIPNLVTTIGMNAFDGNDLTSVTIPSNVMNLGTRAFADNQLTSVCIKNKADSTGFTTYGTTPFTWASWNDNLITWNCPD